VVKGLCQKGCDVTVVAAFPHYPHGNVPLRYRHKALILEKMGDFRLLRVWIPALPHSSVVNRVLLHLSFVVSSLFAFPFVGKVDVIWAANPNLFCFFSALVCAFAKKKPLVRNVDDLWPEVFYEMGIVRSGLMRVLLDFLAKLSYVVPAAITPISAGYKRRIVEKYGVDAGKVHVVEVGVDRVESLVSDNSDKSQFFVMYSGVLGVGYDFETVLKAAALLSEYEDIVFVIRGIGELAPKLERLIKKLGLRNVVLDTNLLPREKVASLLRSADVLVLPMASVGFVDLGLPAKVFEYQAYGKPVICVSGGEPARYVEATGSGLVVKPRDAYGFAEAVVRLYKGRKFASELGLNGWRYVKDNLTVDKVGQRMFEVLVSRG